MIIYHIKLLDILSFLANSGIKLTILGPFFLYSIKNEFLDLKVIASSINFICQNKFKNPEIITSAVKKDILHQDQQLIM